MPTGGTRRIAAAVVCLVPTVSPAADPGKVDTTNPFDLTVGSRYWYSGGRTAWNHDATGASPFLGNPTSVLTYDGLDAHSGELFFDARRDGGWLVKGHFGYGGIVSGALDNEDYFTGQVKFSDTFSRVSGGDLTYAGIDVGKTLYDDPSAGFSVSAFAGYHYWNEDMSAHGVRCNLDDIGGAFCGARGSEPVPFSTKVISNDVTWHSLRIGVRLAKELTQRLSLIGEAAFIPYASLNNADSHHLRSDLGPAPNIRHHGQGYGFQLEAVANYQLTDIWSVGLGARYWHLQADGDVRFGNPAGPDLPLNDFTSSRYGVFVQSRLNF